MEELKKKQLILTSIIFILCGFCLGYCWGYADGINYAIDKGIKILELNNTQLSHFLDDYRGKINIILSGNEI